MKTHVIDTDRLLATFLEMVRIDSPSGDEAAMRDYLVRWCEGLNLAHRVDAGGNLIVEVPSAGCAHEDILVLSGHMDVVPPCHNIQPVVEDVDGDTLITSDNTTVLGADDKAGLAPMLEAVTLSLSQNLPRPRMRLLLTTREEVFLAGAKELDDATLAAAFALTFDHTGCQGVIIDRAPTYVEFTIECTGKSVHAGIMPEQGVNAIVFASKVVEELNLGRIDADTTANIGFFTGGKATNVVPDRAVLRGELRGHNPETLARELRHIEDVLERLAPQFEDAPYRLSHTVQFHGYALGEHPGLERLEDAIRRTGLEPQRIVTNGGSDNNVFVQRGLPGVVLSAGYMDPHSLKERVRLSEMRTCAQLILNAMACFAENPFSKPCANQGNLS